MQTKPSNDQKNRIDQLSSIKLQLLININKKINSLMELDKLLELIMDSCKVLLNAEGSSLMLLDQEKKVLKFNVITGKGQQLKEMEVPIGKGIAGIVAKNGEALIINNAQEDTRVYKAADKITKMVTKNIICVPMKSGGKIIGVLEAINAIDRDYFSDDDLIILMAFAEQAAISITNRKLYDKTKIRADELSALYEISQLTTKITKPNNILQKCLDIVSKVMRSNRCSILLYDKKSNTLKVKAAKGIDNHIHKKIKVPMENEISAKVFQKQRFIFSENVEDDLRFGPNKRLRYASKSFVSVPMRTKEKVIGTLNVTDKHNGKSLNLFDVRLIQTIANQISEVYENIRLYEEEKIKINIEKELEVTRKLQEAIFPKKFPKIKNIEFYALNLPAKEVGGDFYDFYYNSKKPNEFSAIIADVSGKSIPAALFMATSRSIIRAQVMSNHTKTLSKILEEANNLILKDSESAMFVTTFFINCDMNNNTLTYSNGGHNSPLLYKKNSDTVIKLHTKGKPLAVIPDAKYSEKKIKLNSGDIILLYTDGIIEANNQKKHEFGINRLKNLLIENKNSSPEVLTKKITNSIKKFSSGTAQFDDMTLFILKIK